MTWSCDTLERCTACSSLADLSLVASLSANAIKDFLYELQAAAHILVEMIYLSNALEWAACKAALRGRASLPGYVCKLCNCQLMKLCCLEFLISGHPQQGTRWVSKPYMFAEAASVVMMLPKAITPSS